MLGVVGALLLAQARDVSAQSAWGAGRDVNVTVRGYSYTIKLDTMANWNDVIATPEAGAASRAQALSIVRRLERVRQLPPRADQGAVHELRRGRRVLAGRVLAGQLALAAIPELVRSGRRLPPRGRARADP